MKLNEEMTNHKSVRENIYKYKKSMKAKERSNQCLENVKE